MSITGANLDPVMVMRRRALRKARGRRRLMLLCGAASLVALIGLYYFVRASPIFDVHTVAVSGGTAKLDASVTSDTEQAAGGHSLLALDTGAIQRKLEALPAVRSAQVNRDFPNTLGISIVLYKPAVAVTAGKATYLVSDDAHVIAKATKLPSHLVTVSLPSGTPLRVGETTTNRQLAAALWLLHATPAWFRHKFGAITAVEPRAGTVIATVGSNMQLRLGTPDRLDLKMRAVARTLGHMSASDRRSIRYVDVSAPARPAIAFRKSASS